LVRSIGEHGVCAAAVDQSNVTGEDADVDVVHSEILEGARLSDVIEELSTVTGDARSLHDEVLGEELGEALHIVELVGVDVVIVELLEDRQIFGGLLGVVDFLVPFLCGSALAAGAGRFGAAYPMRACNVVRLVCYDPSHCLTDNLAISFVPRLVPAVPVPVSVVRRREAVQLMTHRTPRPSIDNSPLGLGPAQHMREA
jgi:hypothetical protein